MLMYFVTFTLINTRLTPFLQYTSTGIDNEILCTSSLQGRPEDFLCSNSRAYAKSISPSNDYPMPAYAGYNRDNIWEIIIYKGPGYRVYYFMIVTVVVLLLCAGDKSSQQKDINKAIEYIERV